MWGCVTWVSADENVCFVDDGSGLKSDYGGGERVGVRVIFPGDQPTTYQADNDVQGITGILGAEMSEDTTPQPVPDFADHGHDRQHVTRGTCDPRQVAATRRTMGPVGARSLRLCKAVTTASAGDEVWVAAGTYAKPSQPFSRYPQRRGVGVRRLWRNGSNS